MLKRIIVGIAVLASFVPLASFAEYPEKPVEFVVPWPPGDAEDNSKLARYNRSTRIICHNPEVVNFIQVGYIYRG